MKFELPFNLNKDGKYFDYLRENRDKLKYVDCVYMPTFERKHNTREKCFRSSIEEITYVSCINRLKTFGVNINILIQKDATLELVEKYINRYNIKDFTINDDELAKEIKEKYPDVKLRLSITRKVTVEELNTKDFSMYDIICLFFWYNKFPEIVNQLPNKYKYMIICNTHCLYDCKWCNRHWFEGIPGGNCFQERALHPEHQAYVKPEDLKLFENIEVFKLEGRELSSRIIFNEFNRYTKSQPN